MKQPTFFKVIEAARACTLCAPDLPLGPKPLLAADPAARILIIGQAPGQATHLAGIPWADRSGVRPLRGGALLRHALRGYLFRRGSVWLVVAQADRATPSVAAQWTLDSAAALVWRFPLLPLLRRRVAEALS